MPPRLTAPSFLQGLLARGRNAIILLSRQRGAIFRRSGTKPHNEKIGSGESRSNKSLDNWGNSTIDQCLQCLIRNKSCRGSRAVPAQKDSVRAICNRAGMSETLPGLFAIMKRKRWLVMKAGFALPLCLSIRVELIGVPCRYAVGFVTGVFHASFSESLQCRRHLLGFCQFLRVATSLINEDRQTAHHRVVLAKQASMKTGFEQHGNSTDRSRYQ